MKWTLFWTLLALAGCATTPDPDYRPPASVDVPVATSCLPADRPVRPTTYTDRELAKLDDYKLVLALRKDAVALRRYVSELEAVLAACK